MRLRAGLVFTLPDPSPEDPALLREDPGAPGRAADDTLRATHFSCGLPGDQARLLCVFRFQVVTPSEEAWWRRWQEDVLQLALARQSPAGTPGPGKGAPATMSVSPAGGVRGGCGYKPLRAPFVSAPSRQQGPPNCATAGVDWGKAPAAGAGVRSRPAAPPGKRGWVYQRGPPAPQEVRDPRGTCSARAVAAAVSSP